VLAALVPERVLPFASGGSRKRGPEPSRGQTSVNAAVGRRKASAPAPWGPGGPGRLPQAGEDGARPRTVPPALSSFANGGGWLGARHPVGCAYRRSASLLFGGRNQEWLACELEPKTRMQGASRERFRLSAAATAVEKPEADLSLRFRQKRIVMTRTEHSTAVQRAMWRTGSVLDKIDAARQHLRNEAGSLRRD
jgi:hypothetical protein